MTEPAIEPAWHPDPWKQAQLRWHDGTQWTANVHGELAAAPAADASAPAPQLAAAPGTPATPAAPQAARSGAEVTYITRREFPTRGHLIAIGAVLFLVVLAIAGLGLYQRVDSARQEVAAAEAAKAPAPAPAPSTDNVIVDTGPGLEDDPTARNVTAAKTSDPAPVSNSAGSMTTTNARLVRFAKVAVLDIATAIDACAEGAGGSYAGCGAGALKVRADLREALDACGEVIGACVKVTDSTYVVTYDGKGSAGEASFTQARSANGAITRTCTAVGLLSSACQGGSWG